MKLYGAIASPYVTRVVMFARIKNIKLELVEAPSGPRSEEYRSINPIGKIPSLVVDGNTIAESEVICEYLEDMYPTPSGLPKSQIDRASSRMISRITDLYIAPNVSNMVRQVNPDSRDSAVIDESKQAFEKAFGYLEHFMGTGPFSVNETPSLGDCAAGPYMMLLKKIVFQNFEEIKDPTLNNERLSDWWQALLGNEICAQTLDEYAVAVDGFLSFLLKRANP
ncbi:MAG: glutathione S-transferase family protein [Pseudomonadota bacterium]|nr:glutathione S-transferase family protein [Pseudomonadota bacterium]